MEPMFKMWQDWNAEAVESSKQLFEQNVAFAGELSERMQASWNRSLELQMKLTGTLLKSAETNLQQMTGMWQDLLHPNR